MNFYGCVVLKCRRKGKVMRILLLSPNQIHRYNWGHQLFRNEIGNHHDVVYYGNGYSNYETTNVPEIIESYEQFDLILTYGLRYSLPFEKLADVKIKKAHIVIDLFPPHSSGYKGGMYDRYKPFLHRNKYNIIFYRQKVQEKYLKEIECVVPSSWLPFSVDTAVYKKKNVKKIYDVIMSATMRSDIYPNRIKVKQTMKHMCLKIAPKVNRYAYIEAINQSKVAVISVNVFDSPNMKFTEFTSCGTFVLSDKPADFNALGFKDGEHLVLYKDLNDLKDKVMYYLKHEDEREEIAKNGMNFVRKNHNNIIRAKQFTKTIEEVLLNESSFYS